MFLQKTQQMEKYPHRLFLNINKPIISFQRPIIGGKYRAGDVNRPHYGRWLPAIQVQHVNRRNEIRGEECETCEVTYTPNKTPS